MIIRLLLKDADNQTAFACLCICFIIDPVCFLTLFLSGILRMITYATMVDAIIVINLFFFTGIINCCEIQRMNIPQKIEIDNVLNSVDYEAF